MIIVFIVFILFLFSNLKNNQKPIRGITKLFLNKHLIRVFAELTVCTIISIHILYRLNIWEFIHTKETIIWLFFSAYYLSFKIVLGDETIREILQGILALSVLIDFLMNIYTYSLFKEILLILIMNAINLVLVAVDTSKNAKKSTIKLKEKLEKSFELINLLLLISILFKVLWNLETVFNVDNIKLFLIPILLTLMIIPYFFLLLLRVTYENFFCNIKLNKLASKSNKFYFKLKTYIHCRFDRDKISYLDNHKKYLVRKIQTKQDVDQLYKNINNM